MGKINLPRVFLGGIAAGAFVVVVEYILKAHRQLNEAVPAVAPLSFAALLAIRALQVFVGGPLAIWLYAAIRPRFGAGPRTAILAALYIWVVLGPYGLTVLAIANLLVKLPLGLMVAVNIATLPLLVAAMLIGAWVYKEG